MSKIIRYAIITLGILMIPLIAMQLSDEVDWSMGDFGVGALLISSVLVCIDFVLTKYQKSNYKWIIVLAVLTVFLLIWAELAVGVFDSPWAGN